jgi:SPFH domain/Band 7 family protein
MNRSLLGAAMFGSCRTVYLLENVKRSKSPCFGACAAYYRVADVVRSVVAIENVSAAINQLAQTTLRAVVGRHTLDETLSETDTINQNIREILDVQTDQSEKRRNQGSLNAYSCAGTSDSRHERSRTTSSANQGTGARSRPQRGAGTTCSATAPETPASDHEERSGTRVACYRNARVAPPAWHGRTIGTASTRWRTSSPPLRSSCIEIRPERRPGRHRVCGTSKYDSLRARSP